MLLHGKGHLLELLNFIYPLPVFPFKAVHFFLVYSASLYCIQQLTTLLFKLLCIISESGCQWLGLAVPQSSFVAMKHTYPLTIMLQQFCTG